jgi:eukaryotic-like serine/threonine-protein kinase
LAEGEAEYRAALRLRPDYPDAHFGLGAARQAQGKLAEAEAEYRAVLRLRPEDPAALDQLAGLLGQQKGWGAAARLCAEAFAAHPGLAADQPSGLRYDAACWAAQAGCGKGKDASDIPEAERARLRQQALDWLRAELAAWRQLLDKGPTNARAAVQQNLRHWQQDPDFAGVRGDALANLPAPEQQAWRDLWADVEQTWMKTTPKDPNDTKTKSPD